MRGSITGYAWKFLICAGLLLAVASGALAIKAPANPPLNDLDTRIAAPGKAPTLDSAAAQSADKLKGRMKKVGVTFNKVLGTPDGVMGAGEFLTGPKGEGKSISKDVSDSIPVSDRDRPVKGFLKEYSQLFGHTDSVLGGAKVVKDYAANHNGMRTVVWQQQVDGISVFQGQLIAHITKDGELVSIGSRLVADPGKAADSDAPNRKELESAPPVSGAQAVALAAQNIGEKLEAGQVTAAGQPVGPEQKQSFTAPALVDKAEARLVWLPMNRSQLRLCWEVTLIGATSQVKYLLVIDARKGDVLVRRCMTANLNSAYRVFNGDSPRPGTPGPDTPTTYPDFWEPPLIDSEIVGTDQGWLPVGGNTTSGNNVVASKSGNRPTATSTTPHPVFDYTFDLTADPTTQWQASAVSVFYWCNLFHDRMYSLGFNEAAGNFQVDNFGRGGVGNDPMTVQVQGVYDNAYCYWATEGYSPTLVMGLFSGPNPDRDSAIQPDILLHEYTHALSYRLVNGGSGYYYEGEMGGMSEGWSDFFGMALLSDPDKDYLNGAYGNCYATGAYVCYNWYGLGQHYYFGIRRYPYSSDMSKNPLTYIDIDDNQAGTHPGVPISPVAGGWPSEVHNAGEVWCATLWDLRELLIQHHGAAGNDVAFRLAMDGMKLLTSPEATFIEGRNGILNADLADYGGAHTQEIWEAFARRGMGVNASTTGGWSPTITQDFTVPALGNKVATPTISPLGACYTSAQQVTITCATTGATIRYTTNGTDPTETSTAYTGPFTLSADAVLKAKAWKTGMTASDVRVAQFDIEAVAGTKYVDHDAPGPIHDGMTWETAFLTIQEGANAAAAGEEVWVAAGTYVENVLLSDGVALYGGFAGLETDLTERKWSRNPTVIDGGWNYPAVAIYDTSDVRTRLDGFTIADSDARSPIGVQCDNAVATITNNLITNLYGQHEASSVTGIAATDSNLTITSNIIGNFIADAYATGIALTSTSGTVGSNIIYGTMAWEGTGISLNASSPAVVNNTIAGCTGPGIASYNATSVTVTNNIVVFNDRGIQTDGLGTLTLSYNDVYGNITYDYSLGLTPGPGAISLDPQFAAQANCNFHLISTSPCIDAGLDTAPGIPEFDVDAHDRVTGDHVEIGADEFSNAPDGIIRVKWNTSGPVHDGRTWLTAFTTVQQAINAALDGNEVWVAAGQYQVNITLPDGVALYGGFAGTEATRDDRNWRANVTTLNGGGTGPVVQIVNAMDARTRIDGFTIQNGFGSSDFGAGIHCVGSQPTIANNIVTGNYAADYSLNAKAGGIYCGSSAVTILGNRIEGNSSDGTGGGIGLVGSHGVVANNIVFGNGAYYDGGISCGDCTQPLLIANNTVVSNWATNLTNSSGGVCGGISCGSGVEITNNIVAFNHAAFEGGGIVGYGAELHNNDVFGNIAGSYANDYMGCAPDPDSISRDPMFVDYAAGDLHILPDSPCVEAGLNDAVVSTWVDIDGQPRIQPADGLVDMGADESATLPFRVYVKTTGSDTNDGLSWATAKQTVQAGIDTAIGCAPESWVGNNPAVQVWVAVGTYDECITVAEGVDLYGGFAGNETSLSQRDWRANATSLNGQGCDHVVTIGTGVTRNTCIDGFGISGAYTMYGGGIYISDASPTIRNNTISGNFVGFDAAFWGPGGGIYVDYQSAPLIENNVISGNTAFYGGGIYCEYGTAPVIVNNIIEGNWAWHDYYEAGYGGSGGGIVVCTSDAIIANNTITGNGAENSLGESGGGILVSYCNPTIVNNIICFNSDGVSVTSGSTPQLRYNDVYGNEYFNYSPGVVPGPGSISVDPVFGDGWHIQPNSPCVSAGDTAIVQPGWLDIDGQARVQPQGGVVDIGADESDGTYYCFAIRVKSDGNDANNGFTWATAKRTVQAGITAAAGTIDQVWVASGTYAGGITVPEGMGLYGGFAGTETSIDERDWRTNVTTLDGQGYEHVVSFDEGVTSNTCIDGFTIANAYSMCGGGVYCYNASPTIRNNTIKDNFVGFDTAGWGPGGGIYVGYQAEPLIENNVIKNNSAFEGGGIYCDYGSAPSIVNNIIHANSAWHDYYEAGYGGSGGGIVVNSSDAFIANNTIVGNRRSNSPGQSGGGILASGSPVIVNNIICFNDDGVSASGSPQLRYNNVYGNTYFNYSQGITPGTGSISVDPQMTGYPFGDLHIQSSSPCVNAGDNTVVQAGWLDMDGQLRVQPTGGAVDIGADESNGTHYNYTIYVKPDGNDANNGLSWSTAKRTVQAGVNAAGGVKEVWVKAGTYTENLVISSATALYGGFAGTESACSQRSWKTNVTTLYGIGGGSGPVVTVQDTDSAMNRIDGFTITGGEGIQSTGAGIYCSNSTLTVENNTITGNASMGECASAGGMLISNSDVTVVNNTITNNTSDFQGGGILVVNSSGEITRNTITNNTAFFGGGIYFSNCGYIGVRTNVIANNHALVSMEGGGGICCVDSTPSIYDNTIAENTALSLGGGISVIQSSQVSLQSNIIAFGSSGVYVDGTSSAYLSYNDVYGNTQYNYQGVTPGYSNISVNPEFVSLANNDYHLISTSPCIDYIWQYGIGGLDRDGNIRPVDGDGVNESDDWDIGAYEFQPTLGIVRKSVPNGTRVELKNIPVTACFYGADPSGENWVYVETAERTAGIRVKTSAGFSVGQLVNVVGAMQTDTLSGERYIDADTGSPSSAVGTLSLTSLGMRNQWAGGAGAALVPAIKDGFGFYNVGLLVQTWGYVIHRNTTAGFIYINDGSDLYDGSTYWGIKVKIPAGLTIPAYGQYVKITGVCGTEKIGNNYVRVVRARTQSDIQIVSSWTSGAVDLQADCWNMLSLPGIPRYPNAESVFVAAYGEPQIILDGYLQSYNPLAQTWQYYDSCNGFPNCLVAEGYGLYAMSGYGLAYDFERTPVSGDQLVSLPRGSNPISFASFIGNPFDYNRTWSAIKVTDGNSIMSLPDAISAGWIHRVDFWNGSGWQPVANIATGSMAARTGYLVYPKINNLALVVPAQ